jgi:hypothetical protein
MLEVFLMDEESATPSAPIEKAKNGRDIFTDKIADEIVAACGSGFTLEKAGALVGVNANTIKTWASRKPEFARRVETARKKHELSLLRDIELAGAKSWQAKAWMAERIYNHAIPSARLQVSQDVTHGISGNLAQLLAGIAGRKKITASAEKPKLENGSNYIDVQPIVKESKTNKSHNSYSINNSQVPNDQQHFPTVLPKPRHKQMRRRKPRAESLAKYPPTTTPPANPPAPI